MLSLPKVHTVKLLCSISASKHSLIPDLVSHSKQKLSSTAIALVTIHAVSWGLLAVSKRALPVLSLY